jgi:hypothetical protein
LRAILVSWDFVLGHDQRLARRRSQLLQHHDLGRGLLNSSFSDDRDAGDPVLMCLWTGSGSLRASGNAEAGNCQKHRSEEQKETDKDAGIKESG